MRLFTVPGVLAAALLVSACQQTPPPPVRTGVDMIDPATGALYPVFIDQSFSLVQIIEDYIGQPLPNSTRREIDNAQDVAMSQNPVAPGVQWASSIRDQRGMVDLITWQVDNRAGEICGTIEHITELRGVLRGAVTVCRASVDPGWRIDEVIWYGKPRRPNYKPSYRYSYRPYEPNPNYRPVNPNYGAGPTPKPPYGGNPPGPKPYQPAAPQPNYGAGGSTLHPQPQPGPGPAPVPNPDPAAGTGQINLGGDALGEIQ